MNSSPSIITRNLIISFILLFTSAAFYFLSHKLIGELHFERAEKAAASAQYEYAVAEFEKAAIYLPYNNYMINNSLGNIYYRMGGLTSVAHEGLFFFNSAKAYFSKALEANPLDARSAYGLARAKIRLEQYFVLSGKKSMETFSMTVMPALEKAIELRPASSIYHLAMARYLYQHNEDIRLLSEVQVLGRLQPSMLGQLRREPFWSVAVRTAFKLGVQEALAAGTTPRQSFLVLSDIMAEEQKWQEAISYRTKGMDIQAALNASADYIRMGYLFLMADERGRMSEFFFLALQNSKDIEKDIIAVMNTCRKAGDSTALMDFYNEAGKKYGTSFKTDLSAARLLINLQDLENAKTVLHTANARQANAEAYYLLMRIAEQEQDWDAAELAIQKAAMHDPQNSNYHLTFSHVLNRLQKYERAEKEAGLAIQHIDNTSAGLFHYRASLRLKINDYQGALEDWQQAIELDPDNQNYVNQLKRVKKHLKNE